MNFLKSLFLFLFMGYISSFANASLAPSPKKIAITIDDAPTPSSVFFKGMDRTKKILEILKEQKIDQVGVFVIGTYIDKNDGKDRIDLYDQAGHMIGNHTYSHLSARKVSSDRYIKDIAKCHNLIEEFVHFEHYFRYPYLDEGGTKTKKLAIQNYLTEEGYQKAYITINTLDYHVDGKIRRVANNGGKIHQENLKKAYLDLMRDWVELCDIMAIRARGYRPAHILLIHENDINAYFLGDVITMLRESGWDIISPDEAFKINAEGSPGPHQNINELLKQEGYGERKISPKIMHPGYVDARLRDAGAFQG